MKVRYFFRDTKLKEFIISRFVVQKMLKEILQEEGK